MWFLGLPVMLLAVIVGCFVGISFTDATQPRTNSTLGNSMRFFVIDHHSFTPPFLQNYFGDGDLPYWQIDGSTVVTDKYVRLTPDEPDRTGVFRNTEPLYLQEFEIDFGVTFHTKSASGGQKFMLSITTNSEHSYDAMAKKLVPLDGMILLFDMSGGTNWKRNPVISLLHADGNADAKNDHRGKHNAETMPSCTIPRNIITNEEQHVQVRVHYHSKYLSVNIINKKESYDKNCFVSDGVNLNIHNKKYYISLEAQTGQLTEAHDVLFFKLKPLAYNQWKKHERNSQRWNSMMYNELDIDTGEHLRHITASQREQNNQPDDNGRAVHTEVRQQRYHKRYDDTNIAAGGDVPRSGKPQSIVEAPLEIYEPKANLKEENDQLGAKHSESGKDVQKLMQLEAELAEIKKRLASSKV